MMCVVSQSSSVGSSPVPSRVTLFGHIQPFVAAFPALSHVPAPRPAPGNALLTSPCLKLYFCRDLNQP